MKITHDLLPLQFNECNIAAKQFNVIFRFQLSGQTANIVQDSSQIGT